MACGLPNRREPKAITKGFSAVYGLVSTAGKGLHVRVDAQRSALSDNVCDDLSCPSSESPANLARSSRAGESGQGLQPGSDLISEGGSDPLHACDPDDSDLPRCHQHVQSQEPCGPMDGPGWV